MMGLRIKPVSWLPHDMAVVTDDAGKIHAIWLGNRFHTLTDLERKELEDGYMGTVDTLVHRTRKETGTG